MSIADQLFPALAPLSPFYLANAAFQFSTYVPITTPAAAYFPDGCYVRLLAAYLDPYFDVE